MEQSKNTKHPAAELNVLKKELADIYLTLSLLKEEYDRLLKVAPDDRTAEQDKRIEYIDDLSKIRTIRKSEIETEIAGYESQKSEHPKPEAKAKAGGKSTDIIARRVEFVSDVEKRGDALKRLGFSIEVDNTLPTLSLMKDNKHVLFCQGDDADTILKEAPEDINEELFLLFFFESAGVI